MNETAKLLTSLSAGSSCINNTNASNNNSNKKQAGNIPSKQLDSSSLTSTGSLTMSNSDHESTASISAPSSTHSSPSPSPTNFQATATNGLLAAAPLDLSQKSSRVRSSSLLAKEDATAAASSSANRKFVNAAKPAKKETFASAPNMHSQFMSNANSNNNSNPLMAAVAALAVAAAQNSSHQQSTLNNFSNLKDNINLIQQSNGLFKLPSTTCYSQQTPPLSSQKFQAINEKKSTKLAQQQLHQQQQHQQFFSHQQHHQQQQLAEILFKTMQQQQQQIEMPPMFQHHSVNHHYQQKMQQNAGKNGSSNSRHIPSRLNLGGHLTQQSHQPQFVGNSLGNSSSSSSSSNSSSPLFSNATDQQQLNMNALLSMFKTTNNGLAPYTNSSDKDLLIQALLPTLMQAAAANANSQFQQPQLMHQQNMLHSMANGHSLSSSSAVSTISTSSSSTSSTASSAASPTTLHHFNEQVTSSFSGKTNDCGKVEKKLTANEKSSTSLLTNTGAPTEPSNYTSYNEGDEAMRQQSASKRFKSEQSLDMAATAAAIENNTNNCPAPKSRGRKSNISKEVSGGGESSATATKSSKAKLTEEEELVSENQKLALAVQPEVRERFELKIKR